MRCGHCGAEVADGTPMCPTCGMALAAGQSPPPAGQANPGVPQPSIIAPSGGPAAPFGVSQPTRPVPAAGAGGPAPGRPRGGETIAAPQPPPSAPWPPAAPPAPGGYGQPGGSPVAAPYGGSAPQQLAPQPAYPQPAWTPGAPYGGAAPGYAYPVLPARAGLLATDATRAAALFALGGLLLMVFPFLPWITVSVPGPTPTAPGRSDSSSYKDIVDDLDISQGYVVILFLVGVVAIGAGALRWRTAQPGQRAADPALARMAAAAATGAVLVITVLQFLQHSDLADRLKAQLDGQVPPQARALISVGLGWGLYLLPAATAVMLIGLWLDRPRQGAVQR